MEHPWPKSTRTDEGVTSWGIWRWAFDYAIQWPRSVFPEGEIFILPHMARHTFYPSSPPKPRPVGDLIFPNVAHRSSRNLVFVFFVLYP